MKDFLGQEIRVGSKILWSGGQGQYAGFEQIFEVLKVNDLMITIQRPGHYRKTVINPHDVVVVDEIVDRRGRKIIAALMDHAVPDFEKSDECAKAVDAALDYLREGFRG